MVTSNKESGSALFIVLILILLLIFGPLIGIWVINTLFDMNNPYDLTHWFAVLISGFAFGGNRVSTSRSD